MNFVHVSDFDSHAKGGVQQSKIVQQLVLLFCLLHTSMWMAEQGRNT